MNSKIISLLFFLSGLCGLVYQILWARLFSFALGNTYLAISIIVATFMLGLFLGSWLVGRYIAQAQNELKWYAILEIAIGAYAVLLLGMSTFYDSIYHGLYIAVGQFELLHSLGKVIVTFALILIPTAAMGATLPLIVQYCTKRTQVFDKNVSHFYAINTVGGAIGALLAGFFVIEQLGIRMGIVATAVMNAGIGVVVLLVLPKLKLGEQVSENPRPSKSVFSPKQNPILGYKGLYFLAAALAGFTGLAYEIIWTRGLKFLIHNSTYSFTVILFVFLLGIAAGSKIYDRLIKKNSDPHYLYGFLQILLSVYAVFTIYLLYNFSYTEAFQNKIVEIIYDYSYSWMWGIAIYVLIAAMMLLIPTVIMGILFPLLTALYFAQVRPQPGQTVSSIYAINTVGGIAGSLLAGFLLLPVFGIKASLLLIAGINLILGGIFVFYSKARYQLIFLVSVAIVVYVFSATFSGTYLYGRGEQKEDNVVFYEEGLMATVKVFERKGNLFMSIDGSTIASNHPTLLKKEKLIAHLPFFVRPEIRKVLAVGLASGISIGAMSLHPEVEQIDCVELIKPVFPAADHFRGQNFDVANNRKVDLIYDDIYGYLKRSSERYDLISSDGKLGTLYSGNTIMLSKDFYELCKQRMSEDGVFIQWLPIITPHDELRMILNTLKDSFTTVLIFYAHPTDIFMIASQSQLQLDARHINQVLSDPLVRLDLANFGLQDSATVLSSYLGSYNGEEKPSTLNTFDRPYLEFSYMREWKKSKELPGGYRAKNLEYLIENYEQSDFEQLHQQMRHIDLEALTSIVTSARLYLNGSVKFFETGNYQSSYREYFKYKQKAQ